MHFRDLVKAFLLLRIHCAIVLVGQEKKTIVSYFYREFTGAVSSLRDKPSQKERLQRQINTEFFSTFSEKKVNKSSVFLVEEW